MKKINNNRPTINIAAHNGHGPRSPMPPATTPEIPPLSEEDQRALADFHARQQVLCDLTLGCIKGNHTGAYIYGPPGASKSYTILETLRAHSASWLRHRRITAKPFYLQMEMHPGAIHVVDDCEQIFSEKSALTLLRSALDSDRVNGRRERRVSYSVSGSRARILEHYFYGSIIFISNRPLNDEKPEVRAVMSRIPPVSFSPPDREIRALMRHVARQGHTSEAGIITPLECVEIVEHVIQMAGEVQCRLDLRWLEHGFGHYLTQAACGGSVDWRDMLKFHAMNSVTYFDHTPATPNNGVDRREKIARECAIAREIAQCEGLSPDERLAEWTRRTGLSRATLYRRQAPDATEE